MGAGELSRSVLEGVAYSVRLLIEALESSSGVSATRLRHAGGGARSAVWCQIRAKVLDRSVDRVENLDSGVVGAAILAGTAAGVFASIEEASARMVTGIDMVCRADKIETFRSALSRRWRSSRLIRAKSR
jgi:xylulokinase